MLGLLTQTTMSNLEKVSSVGANLAYNQVDIVRPHEKLDTKKICRKTNYRDIRTRKLVVIFKLLNLQTDISVIILSHLQLTS